MNRSLKQQAELTLSLAKRDIKARYKDSILGFLWSLVRPAILTLVFWLVFTKILPMPFNEMGAPFWLHVLVSILGWNFFFGSLNDATHSITSNSSLLKKVRLNCEVFPLAAIISNGVHFALAMIVVVIYLVFSDVGIHAEFLWLGGAMVVQLLLTLGLALALSAMNVYYRDVGSILELGGMALFYITPVIYPVSVAFEKLSEGWGAQYARIYMLNPMAPVVVALRRATLYSRDKVEIPDAMLLHYLLIAGGVGLVLSVAGWLYFHWLSRDFADQL
jgi:ABC-type polysaccharide/polyol phosphate export permease